MGPKLHSRAPAGAQEGTLKKPQPVLQVEWPLPKVAVPDLSFYVSFVVFVEMGPRVAQVSPRLTNAARDNSELPMLGF